MSDVIHGDCLDVMTTFEPESIDAIVTDPPYGLGFMGKHWDHGAPGIPFWAEMLRVSRPSAYLLAFGGTRTVHRIATAIEDAGWVIRDMLVWAYASGFPKSKASLKPAWEPIVMARKPGALRALAIDDCRIGTTVETWPASRSYAPGQKQPGGNGETEPTGPVPAGRWPANVILTDPIFDGGIEGVVGGGEQSSPADYARSVDADGGVTGWNAERFGDIAPGYGDTGTYSRFYLIPKAARSDREPIMGGLEERESRTLGDKAQGPLPQQTPYRPARRQNVHPTVKPVELMRHLVRLVTPPGGVVLDPFLGSGSTAIACELEGFPWIGIEKEAEYVEIARARLNGTQTGMGLVTA